MKPAYAYAPELRQSQTRIEAGKEWIESSPEKKDLRILVAENFNMSLAASKEEWPVGQGR